MAVLFATPLSRRTVVSRPPYIVGGGREGGRRISFVSRRAGRFFLLFSLFYSKCVWAARYGRWGTVVGVGVTVGVL